MYVARIEWFGNKIHRRMRRLHLVGNLLAVVTGKHGALARRFTRFLK
jgi:hypothetical protein